MMRLGPSGALGQRLVDVALIAWTAAWVWMGITVGNEVRGIGELSGTVNRLRTAVTQVGEVLGDLPLIGGEFTEPADRVTEAGRDAVASAQTARASARRDGSACYSASRSP